MKKNELAFQTSLDTRKFEIDLFWKRSLFFWGFIASAFIAFSALYKEGSKYAIVIAGFGCICSLVWTLANRGSKFWQENWETKVADLESDLVGNLFSEVEEVQKKFFILNARKYSVSKLAIALSDYVLIIWVGILFTLIFKYMEWFVTIPSKFLIVLFLIFTLLYSAYIIKFAKTSSRITNKSSKKIKTN